MAVPFPQPIIDPVLLQRGGLFRRTKQGYRLRETWAYTWTADSQEWAIIVPDGFLYDGASVPRWLWSLSGLTPDGTHRAAALVHDFLYHYAGHLPAGTFFRNGEICRDPWTREEADKIFANILGHSHVSRTDRRRMYRAVRVGGWPAWGKAKKQLQSQPQPK